MSTFDERKRAAAEKFANTIGAIDHIECPRNVKNPGIFFGAMLGADFGRADERERTKTLIEAVKEYRRECEAVVPDYTMKRITRERLFAALEASEGEMK